MESAIPEHLRTARTRHRRVPDDYAPPYPSFVARHKPNVQRVVMAYFGVQTRDAPSKAAEQAMAQLTARFESDGGPSHWDRARYVDEAGFTNIVTVAYWDDRVKFDDWFPAARDGWTGDQQATEGYGTFIEALYPSVEGYETLFSSLGRPEGIAVLADGMSAEGGNRRPEHQRQLSDQCTHQSDDAVGRIRPVDATASAQTRNLQDGEIAYSGLI